MPFVMFWNYRVHIMISALTEMWHCHVIFQESARFYPHRTHCWLPVIKLTCHSVTLVMHLKPTYVITRTRPLLKMLVKHSIDTTICVGVLSTHIFRNIGMMFEVWLNNTQSKTFMKVQIFFLFLLVSKFLRCYNFASLADNVPYFDHVFHVTHKAHFFTKREQLNIYHCWLMIFEQAVLVILRNRHPLHVNVLFTT